MKRIISFSLSFLLVLSLFTGCAKIDDPNKPKVKRTDVVIGDLKDASTLDPHKTADEYSSKFFNHIYNSLMKQGNDLTLEPSLAEKWEYKSDTEIIFYLKKGVKFHNGEELKSSDVKFSIERMMNEVSIRSNFSSIASVDTIDDYTVRVMTSEPSPQLMWNLAGTSASIVSQKAVEELGADFGKNPVGTGPMKLKEWRKNNYIVLSRNENYWDGLPAATSLTFKVIPESTMRMVSLRSKSIDISLATVPTDIGGIKNKSYLKTEGYLSHSMVYMAMNNQKPPFDNLLVRQALSHAIDKESIVTMVLEGEGIPLNSVLTSSFQVDNSVNYYPYDIEKAKSLLSEAGFPNGFDTKIYVAGDLDSKAAQVIQADFLKINVNLDITLVELSTVLDYANRGEYELCILKNGAYGNPLTSMANLFRSDASASEGNKSFYKNTKVDVLLKSAKTDMNEQSRNEAYSAAAKIIMEDAPIVPLYLQNRIIGLRSGVDGYTINQNGRHDFYNAFIMETN